MSYSHFVLRKGAVIINPQPYYQPSPEDRATLNRMLNDHGPAWVVQEIRSILYEVGDDFCGQAADILFLADKDLVDQVDEVFKAHG